MKKTVLSVLLMLFVFTNTKAQVKSQIGLSFLQVGATKEQVLKEAFNFKVSQKIKIKNVGLLTGNGDGCRQKRIYKGCLSVDTSLFTYVPPAERFLFNTEVEKYFVHKMIVSNDIIFSNIELFFVRDVLQYVVLDYQPILEEILYLKYGEPTSGELYTNAEWSNQNGSKIMCTKNHIYISLDFYSNLISKENKKYIVWVQSKSILLNSTGNTKIDIENF